MPYAPLRIAKKERALARGFFYAIISATCYGLGPIIFKLGMASGMSELDMLLSRFVIAAPILAAFFLVTDKKKLAPRPRTLVRAAIAAFGFYALESYCFMRALTYIPAATNSLIFYIYPLLVTLLSALFFGFRIRRLTVAALLFILAGTSLVGHDAFVRQAPLAGVFFSLAATFIFSCYLLLVQRFMRDEDPLTLTFYVFVFMAISYAFLHNPSSLLRFSQEQLLWGSLAAIFPTVLAVPLLYASIRKIGGAYASIFSSFELVATLTAAKLVLNEPISAEQVFGMAAIMLGVALPNLRLDYLRRRLNSPAGSPSDGDPAP